jgi:hypothetical protein
LSILMSFDAIGGGRRFPYPGSLPGAGRRV